MTCVGQCAIAFVHYWRFPFVSLIVENPRKQIDRINDAISIRIYDISVFCIDKIRDDEIQ